MKSCPTCSRTYEDTLTYCLIDGAVLSSVYDPHATLQFPEARKTEPPPTEVFPKTNPEPTIESAKTPRPFIPEVSSKPQESKGSAGKIIKRIIISLVIIVLVVLLGISVSWGVYNSIHASSERDGRLRAEQEAESNKKALEEAEKRAKAAEEVVAANEAIRLGKEVWRVVRIENRTQGEIPYQLLVNGEYYSYTVKPGTPLLHEFNSDIVIIYDWRYEDGIQEKRYRLTPKYVLERKPTEAEEQQAKVNYFTLDKNGDIELYADK